MIIRSVLAAMLLASCASTENATTPRADVEASAPPGAAPGSVERGRVLAQTQCAACHALGDEASSPLTPAPRLRDISRRYPIEQLGEAFAEGFVTTHSTMPEFVLDRRQNRDLIAYLVSIQAEP